MKLKLFFLVVSGVLFGAMPSQASIVTVNYTGTVTSAFDNFGIFGIIAPCCNNSPYVGDTFAATFVFNTSLGSGNTSILPGNINLYGGSVYHTLSPGVSATLTVNKFTNSMSGSYSAGLTYDAANPNNTSVNFSHVLADNSIDSLLLQTQNGNPGLFGLWSAYDGCAVEACGFGQSSDFNASMSSLTVSISDPLTTPLPSTWITFLSSLICLGFFTYRRTKKDSAALAAA